MGGAAPPLLMKRLLRLQSLSALLHSLLPANCILSMFTVMGVLVCMYFYWSPPTLGIVPSTSLSFTVWTRTHKNTHVHGHTHAYITKSSYCSGVHWLMCLPSLLHDIDECWHWSRDAGIPNAAVYDLSKCIQLSLWRKTFWGIYTSQKQTTRKVQVIHNWYMSFNDFLVCPAEGGDRSKSAWAIFLHLIYWEWVDQSDVFQSVGTFIPSLPLLWGWLIIFWDLGVYVGEFWGLGGLFLRSPAQTSFMRSFLASSPPYIRSRFLKIVDFCRFLTIWSHPVPNPSFLIIIFFRPQIATRLRLKF